MKYTLKQFQKKAVAGLRMKVQTALMGYAADGTPQIISFTAPTGAGKTIMAASLIESVFSGDEHFIEQMNKMASFEPRPDTIFLWISDSPELNEQSKDKIERKADRLKIGQCVVIDENSFKAETLEEGKVYFLNTQKLSKTSRLTNYSDTRPHTIWDALKATVEQKGDHFIVIIDEAHRGARGREAGRATTIMQKFVKGSPEIPAMPVLIGMSATIERFNALAGVTFSTQHSVAVTAAEVRDSGLLKDRIIIKYPEDSTIDRKMAVLQAGAIQWKDKCDHWNLFCQLQHHAAINPVLIVQVENGSGEVLTATDLDACVSKIEEATKLKFTEGEVVHTFGQTSASVVAAGLEIPYLEPSRISDDLRVKVVFFKENLSTGWDCPRAETMVSFRHAQDSTYIAQLLGRMVRNPVQSRIISDPSLNEVHLFLPYFDSNTVEKVVEELYSTENGAIPTDVYGESMDGDTVYRVASVKPIDDGPELPLFVPGVTYTSELVHGYKIDEGLFADNLLEEPQVPYGSIKTPTTAWKTDSNIISHRAAHSISELSKIKRRKPVKYNRLEIIKAINALDLNTYDIRPARVRKYVESLLDLCGLISRIGLYRDLPEVVKDEIAEKIREYANSLRDNGSYESLAQQARSFKLNVRAFDSFGHALDSGAIQATFSQSDADLDRKFRMACIVLGNISIGTWYGQRFYNDDDPFAHEVDVILFAADESQIEELNQYARKRFFALHQEYRRQVALKFGEDVNKEYNRIVSDSEKITPHSFVLTPDYEYRADPAGKDYSDHLYVDPSTNSIKIKLNSWEEAVIEEEEMHPDFMCWLRNIPRGRQWNLCIPYEMDGAIKPAFPDFIIIRKDDFTGICLDILEPHDDTRIDNLPKAKGFVKYAKENLVVGRLELIRMMKDNMTGKAKLKRLNLANPEIQERVMKANNDDDLRHIFEEMGVFGIM